MRRTLFGKSPELERLAPPRASAREALSFDVSDHESSTDVTLAERPDLNGRYAVIGRVIEGGDVPARLERGDLILRMRVRE